MVVKAKYLERRQLPRALGDVDVRQVIEHHEGQRRGRHHDDHHRIIDPFQPTKHRLAQLIRAADRGYAREGEQGGGNRIGSFLGVLHIL